MMIDVRLCLARSSFTTRLEVPLPRDAL